MKCKRCNVTMERDYDTRTITCPICGKVKKYKTNADKKRLQRLNDELALSYLKELWSTFWDSITDVFALIVALIIIILLVLNK